MAFCRQWLLVLFVLILGGEPLFAASASEDRAFAAAAEAFQDGIWSRAETQLAQFIQNYPKSNRVAEALLLQAQAEFKQEALTEAIGCRREKPRPAAWRSNMSIGSARRSSRRGLFRAAATFNSLVKDFPDSPLRMRAVVEAASALAALVQPGRRSWRCWRRQTAYFNRPGNWMPAAIWSRAGNCCWPRRNLNRRILPARTRSGDDRSADVDTGTGLAACLSALPIKTGGGRMNAALAAATNLFQIAAPRKKRGFGRQRAESLALQAGVLEKLGRIDEAAAVYQQNLTNTAPAEQSAAGRVENRGSGHRAKPVFQRHERAGNVFCSSFPIRRRRTSRC